ncbi:thymidylate synthase [Patescibacteria group bacterium]
MLKPVFVTARDLPDLWHQCVFLALEEGVARKRMVTQGSFEGEFRLEFDYLTGHVLHPGSAQRIPEIPKALEGMVPPPTDMDYVDRYFARYILGCEREGNEQYTYGERATAATAIPVLHIPYEHLYVEGGSNGQPKIELPKIVNQVELICERYRDHGHGNNQLIIQIGQPCDVLLRDPPCLRHIDTRIEEGKLHFIIYYRSWDLWSGLPANLAAIQYLKEYMAQQIGVGDGEMIISSKGLHLYGYTWEIAGCRRGLTAGEMKLLMTEIEAKRTQQEV